MESVRGLLMSHRMLRGGNGLAEGGEGSGHSRPTKGQFTFDLQGAGGSALETPTLRSMGGVGCGLLLRTRGIGPDWDVWAPGSWVMTLIEESGIL